MKRKKLIGSCISLILIFICFAPYVYIFIKSFLQENGNFTLQYYYDAFLATSQFLLQFWRSLLYGLVIVIGQILVSIFAGYGFAKCHFRGKNAMFLVLMIFMIMPVQVTLVPNYMLMQDLNLLNTFYAIALPAIFVPLGTFIITQSFRSISNDVMDASRLDGCSLFQTIFRIAVPMSKSSVICVILLSFLDSWNMVEQPIVLLNDFRKYPLAVALASVQTEEPTVQLVCCLLVILPPLFLFSFFHRELLEGIAIGKEH